MVVHAIGQLSQGSRLVFEEARNTKKRDRALHVIYVILQIHSNSSAAVIFTTMLKIYSDLRDICHVGLQ